MADRTGPTDDRAVATVVLAAALLVSVPAAISLGSAAIPFGDTARFLRAALTGDDDRPDELIAAYRRRLVPGSVVAISHIASEQAAPELQAEVARLVDACAAADEHVHVRARREILGWFDEGMQLVEPGLVCLPDWRPDNFTEQSSAARPLGYGGSGPSPEFWPLRLD